MVGAGIGGLYAVHALREHGLRVTAYEAGPDVGGTWYWNRYPGARCDVESLDYQYSFSQDLVDEWTWSERYATQPEILSYINWVAQRLDLRRNIELNTQVLQAVYDEDTALWSVSTDAGETVRSRFLVTAAGSISATMVPDFPGIEDFAGEQYHPGKWPAVGVQLAGKRVGVIGVGSSGVQLIPELADAAEELIVFQRTPAYSIPARNRALGADEIERARRDHRRDAEQARWSHSGINLPITGQRILDEDDAQRLPTLEKAWKLGGNLFLSAYIDTGVDLAANDILADFVRDKINSIVRNPVTAERLTPRSYPIGAKRIVTDTDFFATFNRDHVRLVSLREEPLQRIEAEGIRTEGGFYPVDVLVFATGYDNLTGSLTRMDIRGRGGIGLRESWADGAHTYLGLAVAGFPNLFTITGPQSPSVLVNMFQAVEQHVDWIVSAIVTMRDRELIEIEATPEAEQQWSSQVDEALQYTLYGHADSWYRGANVAGKRRQTLVYCGGLGTYRGICEDIAADGYRGFRLSAQPGLVPESAGTVGGTHRTEEATR
ncbi:flavin-containing monooxygenase [Leucobacter sp. M11]|uniref:flavin-containing monooxygenase n=1 Tax=Leucobacter sp. M11 TaxID=2993565 RepID=UPI002D7EF87B|nr:NAD(P)/FAD-dependent oxidoreductase [Leucobacter sp. M11]MEB4616416.1 NAD(P)/FAD-dependent oxidoreductase [Leucobacter sp. M11]